VGVLLLEVDILGSFSPYLCVQHSAAASHLASASSPIPLTYFNRGAYLSNAPCACAARSAAARELTPSFS
jgi:hypothetical protein